MEKWVDSKLAAEHLGKSPDWLVSNVRRLKIPHAFAGRQYRFKLSEIDDWLKDNLVNTNH
jgi:excisionase family DNA binding protein